MGQRARLAHRSALASCLVAIMVVALSPSVVLASPFVTFEAVIGETCFTGAARPVGSIVVIRVNTPGGQAKGYARGRVGTDSRYQACFGGIQTIVGLLPGDQIVARIGDFERRWTVPAVDPVVNRDTEAVSGSTLPNSSVHVLVQTGHADRRRPRDLGEMTVATDSTGHYRADFAGTLDVWGSDEATVTVAQGGDSTTEVGVAILLEVRQGSNVAGGYASSFRPFEVQLVAPGPGAVRATATAFSLPPDPAFGVGFVDEAGNPVYPRPGDRVLVPGEGGASVRFPKASLAADLAADDVVARCMADSPYELRVQSVTPGHPLSLTLRGTTGPDGRLRRHVGGDIRKNDYLELTCTYPGHDTFLMIASAR